MKLGRFHITFFLAMATIVWFLVLVAQGTPVTWAHGQPFAIVVGVLAALGIGLERFFWHRPLFRGWLVKRPDLRGTWRIKLQSNFVDPKTGELIGPIICYMGINQTFSTLKMHLMTQESESWVLSDHIAPAPSGRGYQVSGVYRNEPGILARERGASEMHHGAFILTTHGSDAQPNFLKSDYWTDRKTMGTMEFMERIKEVHTNFETADSAFQKQE